MVRRWRSNNSGVTGALVRRRRPRDKGAKVGDTALPIRTVAKALLDFALPPRCAGCGDIIDDVGSFCPTCWKQMEWLGNTGCQRCGLPLAGTEIETCGRCLTDPPRLDRMRAAVAYDELPRSIALRL